MDIENIRKLCMRNQIVITEHLRERMQERDISAEEVRSTIMNGKIIEEYPDDYPFPSCLILRSIFVGRPIHIVVGVSETMLYLITAYIPDPRRWDATFERRLTSNGE